MSISAARIARDLIRFDTTNPPGNEAPCVAYVDRLLRDAGVPTTVLAAVPDRPNLVARLPGRGAAPPLLLLGHSDVVTTEGQAWSQPPFEGRIVDGVLYGRGALDMKGPVAMMLTALLRLAAGRPPAGDVILALVADEENTGELGSTVLVERHRELFAGVRHGIGEDGGTSLRLGPRRIHPIVVAEKRACRFRIVVRGPAGHGAVVAPAGSTPARLGRLLTTLAERRLPLRMVPVVESLLAELSRALPDELAGPVRRLAAGDDGAVVALPPAAARYLDSAVRNTANPTIVRAGSLINVLPAEASVDVDGRVLPGVTADEFEAELRALAGDDVTLEPLYEGPPTPAAELGQLYRLLERVLRDADPDALVLPMLMTASTDARIFAALGIRFYGFLPLRLPVDFPYQELLHAADERVPVESLEFGTRCLEELLLAYSG